MEGDHRWTSIYDLTGLRVHPNGYRVHQTQRNLEFRSSRQRNVLDSRGWIADDAGGSIIAPKYRSNQRTSPSEAEYIEAQGADGPDAGEEAPQTESTPSVQGKRKLKANNGGPLKRKRFTEDDSYIFARAHARDSSNRGLQLPSQDLLKNIHHLAANYYDEHGLLINANKRYHEAKKQRKLRKLGSKLEVGKEGVYSTVDGDTSEIEQAPGNGGSGGRRRNVNRDMYRVLDGSVLVAIGVLTQEMVKKLLRSRERKPRWSSTYLDGEGGKTPDNEEGSVESEEEQVEGDEEEVGA